MEKCAPKSFEEIKEKLTEDVLNNHFEESRETYVFSDAGKTPMIPTIRMVVLPQSLHKETLKENSLQLHMPADQSAQLKENGDNVNSKQEL